MTGGVFLPRGAAIVSMRVELADVGGSREHELEMVRLMRSLM